MDNSNSNKLFDVFSSKVEYSNPVRDEENRVIAYNAEHDVSTPVVSDHLHSNGFKPAYPNNKKFAVCISHDLDQVIIDSGTYHFPEYKGGLKSTFEILSRELQYKINRGDRIVNPDWDPEKIIDQYKKWNFKSTFFTLCLKEDDRDFNFRLEELHEVFENIRSNGGEIQVHGGHEAFMDGGKMESEKKYFETNISKATGYRNHYLKFQTPDTWNLLKDNGYLYDSTYGFQDAVGFRNGMCYPFMPFDLNKEEFIDIVEVPLIVMDSSIFKYMHLETKEGVELVKRIIDKVEKVNGVFTLLWHNTCFTDEKLNFFNKVMEYLSERDPWFATTGEIVDHYKDNNYIDQIKEGIIAIKPNA